MGSCCLAICPDAGDHLSTRHGEAGVGQGTQADVAVICVTYNACPVLPAFAEALAPAARGCDVRVVIVDSGSTDGSTELAARLMPGADIGTLGGNAGYAAGINAGVAFVRATGGARTFVVTNPDIVLAPTSLAKLRDALQGEGVGVAAPRLLDEHGHLALSLRRRPRLSTAWIEAVLGASLARRLRLPTEVVFEQSSYVRSDFLGWATGGLLGISSACLEDVGPWDESFFLYEEEVDFLLRVGDAGWRLVYVPDALATRPVGDGVVAPWAEALMRTNRLALLRRRWSGARLRSHRAASVVHAALRSIAGRPEARAALWAVSHSARPDAVLRRYRPDVQQHVQPNIVSATSSMDLLRAASHGW